MDGRGLPTRAQLALSSGREISSNGRMYVNGAACDMEIKLAVADTYQRIARERRLVRPNHSEIAILHSVDPKFVKKVEEELWCHGRVLSPQEIRGNADRPIGPGSISLSQYDFFIIMRLYWENPSRGLKSYTDYLWLMTGNIVCTNTIKRVLHEGFLYKGSRLKPNFLPLDKFKPENVNRAYEYLTTLFTLNPEKVIFVDEKHGKAQEVLLKYVRRDPTTGIVPSLLTESDFRNTYSITSFCSINRRKYHPLWYRIHTGTNGKQEFWETSLAALRDGYFEEYDVVVADCATIHNDIEDLFWQVGKVLFIFLPTRTPEWNPKELNWQLLLQRLSRLPLDAIKTMREDYGGGQDVILAAIKEELDGFTFDDVEKNYAKCYDFFPHWRALRDKARLIEED